MSSLTSITNRSSRCLRPGDQVGAAASRRPTRLRRSPNRRGRRVQRRGGHGGALELGHRLERGNAAAVRRAVRGPLAESGPPTRPGSTEGPLCLQAGAANPGGQATAATSDEVPWPATGGAVGSHVTWCKCEVMPAHKASGAGPPLGRHRAHRYDFRQGGNQCASRSNTASFETTSHGPPVWRPSCSRRFPSVEIEADPGVRRSLRSHRGWQADVLQEARCGRHAAAGRESCGH